MLTYKDCVHLTDLEEGEIEAIARHERLPEIVAAEYGCCLAHEPGGEQIIDQMIRDDIDTANRHQQPKVAMHWQAVLQRFETTHNIGPDQA
ncbi:MAG: hypothetical protein IPP10_17045 [Candidatus Competibacteraceae bacterium]|nr:hypothetical protein [Candidatus Competibacteraceae bacterium]MBK9953112.1 hypothetical protein [Candidatus Competibacteraceae bacterium]